MKQSDDALEKRKQVTSMTIDPETKQMLNDLARSEDRSRSSVMRLAIRQYAEAQAARATRW